MKGGITAARELGDFLRERAKIEEDNSKAQIKLANKLTPATVSNTCGTFTPLLLAFKVTTDKLSGIHNQWSMKLNDLLREVLKYNDEQQKKHKQVRIFILAYYFGLGSLFNKENLDTVSEFFTANLIMIEQRSEAFDWKNC